jgi:hypothetical protein
MSQDSKGITDRMLSKIGQTVTFRYPEKVLVGNLEDRHVLPSQSSTGVPYWDVVDLIDFPGESDPVDIDTLPVSGHEVPTARPM